MHRYSIGQARTPWLGGVGLLLALMIALSPPASARELPNFSELVERYGPAVVNVRAVGTQPARALPPDIPEPFRRFFEEFPERGTPRGFNPQFQGSGFIISADGYILTNTHVIADSEDIIVKLNDRREYPAELIGSDERTDVALLKIDADNLPSVKLGNSDQVKVGDWVLAIGSPFGFERTATQGIVSALSRSLPAGTYVPFIQTDVAVNPGNSGGPLFDVAGNVVGVNSQIYSRSGGYMGLSFAIPINVAMDVVAQLKDQGFVERGWLGVSIQDMNQQLAESFGLERPKGALVAEVTPGSPAAAAGIQTGDVIVRFDGKAVERSSALPPLVGAIRAGTETAVEVLRDGARRTLTVTVGKLEESPPLAKRDDEAGGNAGQLGLVAQDLEQKQAEDLGGRGVVVSGLQPNGPAAAAGLQPNDIILSFNRQNVRSVEQLKTLVEQAPVGKPVVMLVQRQQGQLFVPVVIPKEVG